MALSFCVASCSPEADDAQGANAEFRNGGNASEATEVFSSRRLIDADGEVLEEEIIGEWTLDLARRVAHPERYVGEGAAVEDVGFVNVLPGGQTEVSYRVSVRELAVEDLAEPAGLEHPRGVSPVLAAQIADVSPDTPVRVFVQVAAGSSAEIPHVPSPRRVTIDEYAQAAAERDTAELSAASLFGEHTESLRSAIEDLGGTVAGVLWNARSVVATVPAHAVAILAEQSNVAAITPVFDGGDGLADYEPLGTIRTAVGSQAYHDAGYHGQISSGNELLLGILESYAFEDDACFLGDSSCDPDARIRQRFTCSSSSCSSTTDFVTADEKAHGTIVSSAALADYTQSQALGKEASIAAGLSSWEEPASGYAKEAELYYYAAASDDGKVNAYECARGSGTNCAQVDVLNVSNGLFSPGYCDAASWLPTEDALEDAWDAGVLPVVIVHNDGLGPDACEVRSPADLPKALAVAALDPDNSLSYPDWVFADYSNRGGGLSKIGFVQFSTAMSMVDLVAPGRPGHVTTEDGTYGEVSVDGPREDNDTASEGTSFAAPQVAGAAIQVKHRMLDIGATWIDDPGRLHAVMLAMGDRATAGNGANGATDVSCISGGRILCGADRQYGLGRLRLRFHDSMWMRTNTFTASTQYHEEIAFGAALPTGKKMVKCVTQQREDMNDVDKDDISWVTLTVQVRGKYGGACVLNQGTLHHTITDDLPDDKHMVTVLDSQHNIEGNCIQLIVDPTGISSAGSVTTHTYCQADSNLDY